MSGNSFSGFIKATDDFAKACVINDFLHHFDIDPSTMEYGITPKSPKKVSEILDRLDEDNRKLILEKFDINEKENTAVRKK